MNETADAAWQIDEIILHLTSAPNLDIDFFLALRTLSRKGRGSGSKLSWLAASDS
jgi:hypothetical protein